jgi:hypothetical protein
MSPPEQPSIISHLKTVNKVYNTYASDSIRAAMQASPSVAECREPAIQPADSASNPQARKQVLDKSPSRTNTMSSLNPGAQSSPPMSTPLTAPATANGKRSLRLSTRRRYSNSVLGATGRASSSTSAWKDDGKEVKEEPTRQPRNALSVDELRRHPERNFAARRS